MPVITSREHRVLLQDIFVRVCRDSGFTLDVHRACSLAAKVVGSHPLLIWIAMPSLDVMERVAEGKHPAAHRDSGSRSQSHDPQGHGPEAGRAAVEDRIAQTKAVP